MNKIVLEGYRFTGFHKSHIGAIKSCIDYFNLPYSAAWIFGMTGSAFMIIVDEHLSVPNMGEPETAMFNLARHVGLDIRGFHDFESQASFNSKQREAWDGARAAIDQGLPVFAKELDLGNETSLVYAYDDQGYYTHSWHAGHGHEGFDDVIPWTELGRNYCPCASCRAEAANYVRKSDSIFNDHPKEGGFISLHIASSIKPSDDLTALRSALMLALEFFQREAFEWGGRTFYCGLTAYDKWMAALRNDTILGFYMGYFVDILHESRRYATQFLIEASEKFEGSLSIELKSTAEHYQLMEEAYRFLNDLFPWSQPHAPIEDPDRRQEAIETLNRIRQLESDAHQKLYRLVELIEGKHVPFHV